MYQIYYKHLYTKEDPETFTAQEIDECLKKIKELLLFDVKIIKIKKICD
jgi:hypothetical protein